MSEVSQPLTQLTAAPLSLTAPATTLRAKHDAFVRSNNQQAREGPTIPDLFAAVDECELR